MDEGRSETPPPSYNEASCLRTYNEACISIPSLERKNRETHITQNPMSSIDDTKQFGIDSQNTIIDESTNPQNLLSFNTDTNIASSSERSFISSNYNLTQEIRSSVSGAYTGILSLLHNDLLDDKTTLNSNRGSISSPTPNAVPNPVPSRVFDQGRGQTTSHGPWPFQQFLSDTYSTVSNAGNQPAIRLQTPAPSLDYEGISSQNVTNDNDTIEDTIEDGNEYRVSDETLKDHIFRFYERWCVSFQKQCNRIFLCFAITGVVFMALFVIYRLYF